MNRTRLLGNRHRPPRRAVGGKGSGAGKERDWEPRRPYRLAPPLGSSLTPRFHSRRHAAEVGASRLATCAGLHPFT